MESVCDIVMISWAPNAYRLTLLKNTLASIRRSTTVPYRLIVVDNGPAEQTALIRAAEPDLHIINKQNVLPGVARNIGAAQATAPYIAFVDNDIKCGKGWLQVSIDELERYPKEKLIATPLISKPMRYKASERRKATLPDGSTRWYLAASTCLVMKQETWQDIGPWPATLMEDRKWAQRAVQKGYEYALIAKPCVRHCGKAKSFHLNDQLIDGHWRQHQGRNRHYWAWLWRNKAGMNIRKHQTIYNAVRPYLKGHIVDLGYGVTDLYKDQEYDVLGVDISPEAQTRMQKMFPFGDWRVGDIQDTHLPSESADTVLLISVLEHFPEYEGVLREAKRLCRGRLVILVPKHHFDRDHRHPIWDEDQIDKVRAILGEIDVQEEPLSQSWLIVWNR
jgi:GT2 family glycosyltransferase